MSLNTLFKTLVDASGISHALTKILQGDVIDGTKNGLLSFAFRDSSGNAIAPQLNFEGSLPVTFDAGLPVGEAFDHLDSEQTVDQEDTVGDVALTASKTYTRPVAHVSSTRDMLWRLAQVNDATVTTLGWTITGAGKMSGVLESAKSEITTGATGTQVLRLFATPLDKESDAYAQVKAFQAN